MGYLAQPKTKAACGGRPRLRTKTKTKGRQSERVDATRIDRVDISAAVI